MLDLTRVFDPDISRRPAYRRLLGEAWSMLTYRPAPPAPEALPDGAGQAVLVVPAFLTGDWLTRDLRRFLARCGFRPFAWNLGINWGPTPRLLAGLEQRLDLLRREHGKVALIGISLGGLLARNLAYDHPDDISHVVTIASPFRLPTASTVEPLIRLCARYYSPKIQPARLLAPLPVPSTMIYTRDDGVVAWDSCVAHEAGGEAIELDGAHVTLGSNPVLLRAVVHRLTGSK